MAGTVIGAAEKPQPEYTSTKSSVLAITEARTVAVKYADSDGKVSMALALIFGKDSNDGLPGVFLLADDKQMQEQLRRPPDFFKNGVRERLEQLGVEVEPESDYQPDASTEETLNTLNVEE